MQENMHRLTRLMGRGLATLVSATIKQGRSRLFMVFQVEGDRWSCKVRASLHGKVGINLGVRRFATVVSAGGTVLEVIENLKALENE